MSQLNLFIDMPETEGVFTTPLVKAKKKAKKYDSFKIKAQLRKRRESCLKKANDISTEVSGNWTTKRAREAGYRKTKKENLEKVAQFYTNLIKLWDEDNVPDLLKEVRNDKHYELLKYGAYPRELKNEYDWYAKKRPEDLKKSIKMGIESKEDSDKAQKLVEELSVVYISPEEQRQRDLKEKLDKIRGMKIPGFFPTPDNLIDSMIYLSDLKDGDNILEPSAGIGSILDRVKSHFRYNNCKMICCEASFSLQSILKLKGYTIASGDIFEMIRMAEFDTILMNPPFEKQQDIDHVMYCFNYFLKKGGNLVSVMSAGVRNNNNKKAREFREFVDNHGFFEDVPEGAFKGAFNSTGVSVTLVKLTK